MQLWKYFYDDVSSFLRVSFIECVVGLALVVISPLN